MPPKLRRPTGQGRLCSIRMQQKFSLMGPILFVYYEESLVSSNLNSKLFRLHSSHPKSTYQSKGEPTSNANFSEAYGIPTNYYSSSDYGIQLVVIKHFMTVISDFDIKNNTLPTLVGRFYNVGTINFTAIDNLMIDWLNFFLMQKGIHLR